MLIALVFAVVAQAQASVAITGVVVDPTGGVLPNARVTVTCGGSAAQSASTDANGTFRLEEATRGRCEVAAAFDGFETTTVRVTIGARPPAALRITLPLARIQQNVTVGNGPAEVAANAAANLDAAGLDTRTIESLPIFNQDVLATISRFLDASAVGANGATLVVNGLEVNSLNVPASAIQQIKINQDPYAAEFQRPGRGRIEIITKPGSQSYQGTANVVFRDSALDARNAFATVRPPEQRRLFEGFLSGPVRHSAATLFTLSGRIDSDDTQSIVVAQDLSGPVRSNVATPFQSGLAAGTVTHQFSPNNTMSLTLSYQDDNRRNQGVGGFTLAEAGVNWDSIEQDTIFNQQTILTPKLLNQFRILIGLENEQWTSVSATPSIVVLDAFTRGGAQADHLRTERHLQMADTLTWSSGRHVVKTGVSVPDFSRRRWDDNTNTAGTFYFSSLDDYTAGRPYSFVQQVGDGHVVFLDKQLGGFLQDEIRMRPNLSLAVGVRYDWQNYVSDYNNVSPRASLAFAPTQSGTTVIRGGAGVFYDRTGANPIQDILRFDGQRLLRVVLSNPGYPNPLQAGQTLSAEPPSLVTFAPDLTIPYTLQYSVSVERQLRKRTSASVTYTGSRGFDQFRSRDVNAPLPPAYAGRPDPTLGVVRQVESAGKQVANSVQFTLRGEITRWFNGSAQYALSKTMNDTGGINWMPPNSADLSGEYARADFDQRHRFDLLGTINPGSLFNLGLALALYSGRPYSILTGHDDFNTGTANARPAGVPRNSLDGPAYANLDLRWSRDIRLNRAATNGPSMTIAIDAFNVMNHVNATRYIGTLTSPFFGQAISAQPPRRVQISARFKF